MLEELHCSGLAVHFGPDRTFAALETLVWWPKMMTDVCRFIGGFEVCYHAKENVEV